MVPSFNSELKRLSSAPAFKTKTCFVTGGAAVVIVDLLFDFMRDLSVCHVIECRRCLSS